MCLHDIVPFFGSIWNGSVLQVSRVKSAIFWPKVRKLTPDMAVTVQSETSLSGQLPPVRYQWRHTFSEALAVSCLEWFRDFSSVELCLFKQTLIFSIQDPQIIASWIASMPITHFFCLDPGSCFFFRILYLTSSRCWSWDLYSFENPETSHNTRCLESGELTFHSSLCFIGHCTWRENSKVKKIPRAIKTGDNRQKWLVGMLLKPLFLNTNGAFFLRQSLFSFNKSAQKLTLALKFPTQIAIHKNLLYLLGILFWSIIGKMVGVPLKW